MNKVLAVLLLVSLAALACADQMVQDSYSQYETESPPAHLPQFNQPKFHFGEELFPDGKCHSTPIDPDADCIPGKANIDYPDYTKVPSNHFDCAAQEFPGLYADTKFRCQVFHICDLGRTKSSFLCPKGTILDQRYFVCVWWFNFNCEDAPLYYFLNEGFYNTSIPPPVLPGPISVRNHPEAPTPPAHAPAQPAYNPPPTAAEPVYNPPPTAAQPVYAPPPTAAPTVYTPPPTAAEPVYTPPPTAAQPVYAPPPTAAEPVYTPPPTAAEPAYTPPPTAAPIVYTPPPTPAHPVPSYPAVHAPRMTPQFHPAPHPHTQFSPQRVHHTAGHKGYVGSAPTQGNRMPMYPPPAAYPQPAYPQPAYPQPANPPAYQPSTPFVPETRPANYF